MSSPGKTASHQAIPAHRIAAHHRMVKGARVVKTWISPLVSSDRVYWPIIRHFCRFKLSSDTTKGHPSRLSVPIETNRLRVELKLKVGFMLVDKSRGVGQFSFI